MLVKVEVLYVPTCAGLLMWLEKIKKAVSDFGCDVALDEIDVSEHPEALKKYPSYEQQFKDGYIHYFIFVFVNGKGLDNWYWDTTKVAEAIRQENELERAKAT